MTGVKDDHEEGDGVCGIKNDDGGQQDGRDDTGDNDGGGRGDGDDEDEMKADTNDNDDGDGQEDDEGRNDEIEVVGVEM